MLNYIVAKRVFARSLNKDLFQKINQNMWETKDFNFLKKNRYNNYTNYYKTPEFKNYKPNLKQ